MLQRGLCATILVALTACAPALVGTYVGTVHFEGWEGRSNPARIAVDITSPTAYYLRFDTNERPNNVPCAGQYTMTTWSASAFSAVGSGRCDVADSGCGSLAMAFNGGHGELVKDHLTATFNWTAVCARTQRSAPMVEIYELTKRQ